MWYTHIFPNAHGHHGSDVDDLLARQGVETAPNTMDKEVLKWKERLRR